MPYIAKKTFTSPFGSFTEKKVMKFIKKPSKATMKDWLSNDLVMHVPDAEDPDDLEDIEVPPPMAQEASEPELTEEQLEAATKPTPFMQIPTPPRSLDQGGMTG